MAGGMGSAGSRYLKEPFECAHEHRFEATERIMALQFETVERRLERSTRTATLHYAWPARTQPGQALSWWLERLERPITRRALLQAPANV